MTTQSAPARAYAAATGMTWTLADDPGSNLSLAFGTRGPAGDVRDLARAA